MKSSKLIKIINWLEEMEIENYTINDDLTVDVDGNVDIYNKNLIEIPIQFGAVKGSFDCDSNQLTSLEGAPRKVGEGFYCYNNQLTSLEGAPKRVGESFDCSRNQLTSLEGAPREVGGWFSCDNNKKKFTKEEVRAVCSVEGNIWT